MLSRETLEEYRRMTPGQRLELTFKLTEEAEPYLFAGTPEQVKRRFDLLRRQNDERNRRMLEAIARTKPGHFERCHAIGNELITKCLWDDKAGITRSIDRAMRNG